ncbi:NAD-dependent epimerase/dehydratase family protein [Phaeobacter inhibens]|uniref:NAD-dependent epimerase/dehydratase family protein n=1 Tax=Phaeobacter inhibens TaxID=221822 RepID=UPI0021A2EE89|nr:NAD(P)-dependent oxidoreductase [Phaeobacter inhibens]UWR47612.1 NAD(P)-dependent oxidoreductase [Phaeobacter inhibens]
MNALEGKNVLLTGATGFLGGLTLQHLRDVGCNVTSINRNSITVFARESEREIPCTTLSSQEIYDALGDLGDLGDSTLIHLAANAGGQEDTSNIANLVQGNFSFGLNVIEAARKKGCRRVLNFGTFWQYDQTGQQRPVNLYAALKECYQAILDYYCDRYKMNAFSMILSDTYGEKDFRAKVVNHIIDCGLSKRICELSEGRQKIRLLHHDDFIDGLSLALTHILSEEPKGIHFKHSLFGQDEISIRELVSKVSEVTEIETNVHWGAISANDRVPERPFEPFLPISGWQPIIELEDGIRRTFLSRLALMG